MKGTIKGVCGRRPQVLLMNVQFSLCFVTKYKAICKENLALYQKSLRAFIQAPLQFRANPLITHF